jgi:hypothetical protein
VTIWESRLLYVFEFFWCGFCYSVVLFALFSFCGDYTVVCSLEVEAEELMLALNSRDPFGISAQLSIDRFSHTPSLKGLHGAEKLGIGGDHIDGDAK